MTYTTQVVTSSNTFGVTFAAEQWLTEVTYKPGWAFEIRHGSMTANSAWTAYPGVNLCVLAYVPDTNAVEAGPKRFIHTFPLSPDVLYERERFLTFVLHCVLRVEAHETMEYLRAGGVRVKNPHPQPGMVLYG
jgi:hypothetical protein